MASIIEITHSFVLIIVAATATSMIHTLNNAIFYSLGWLACDGVIFKNLSVDRVRDLTKTSSSTCTKPYDEQDTSDNESLPLWCHSLTDGI